MALALVQKLAAETLAQMSSDYYGPRLKAAGMVAEAAIRNQEKQNGRKGYPD